MKIIQDAFQTMHVIIYSKMEVSGVCFYSLYSFLTDVTVLCRKIALSCYKSDRLSMRVVSLRLVTSGEFEISKKLSTIERTSCSSKHVRVICE